LKDAVDLEIYIRMVLHLKSGKKQVSGHSRLPDGEYPTLCEFVRKVDKNIAFSLIAGSAQHVCHRCAKTIRPYHAYGSHNHTLPCKKRQELLLCVNCLQQPDKEIAEFVKNFGRSQIAAGCPQCIRRNAGCQILQRWHVMVEETISDTERFLRQHAES